MKFIVTLEKSDLFPPFSHNGGDRTNWANVRRQFNGFPSILAPGTLVYLVDRFETELSAQIIFLSSCNEMQRLAMHGWCASSGLIGPVWRQPGQPGERKLVLRQDDSSKSDLQWKAETITALCAGEEVVVVVDGDDSLVPLLPDNVASYDSLFQAQDLLPQVANGAATSAQTRRY